MDGKTLKIGSTVRAVILDVAKSERLIDLSLKPQLVEKFERDASVTVVFKKKQKKGSKKFKLHETVNSVV